MSISRLGPPPLTSRWEVWRRRLVGKIREIIRCIFVITWTWVKKISARAVHIQVSEDNIALRVIGRESTFISVLRMRVGVMTVAKSKPVRQVSKPVKC